MFSINLKKSDDLICHDHSCLALHGILALMVGVVYDPVVFKTESEVG